MCLTFPRKTPKGRYKLSFKLFDQMNEKKQDIQIGVNDKIIDIQGFVYVGIVSVWNFHFCSKIFFRSF